MAHCGGGSTIFRDSIGSNSNSQRVLRFRTAQSASCHQALHGSSPRGDSFDPDFHARCNSWANEFRSIDGRDLSWYGYVGVTRDPPCGTSHHYFHRALDLTRLQYPGAHIDMNSSWCSSATLASRRGYIGAVASLRRWFRTVLGAGYPQHNDHVHFDNGSSPLSSVPNIRTSSTADTLIVQRACVEINGSTMSIDGSWGTQTWNGYYALLDKLNMCCLSPTSNASHARLFLYYVSLHGLRNRAAGYWKYSCSNCPV